LTDLYSFWCLFGKLSSIRQARTEYALLLPWAIANGPTPPNAADLEHQNDVLKTCAKLRSQVIDRLNMLEYMMDPRHISEFIMAAGDAERLAKLHSSISDDYDIIQSAASYAINNAKLAVEPETNARTVKNLAAYSITVLSPDELPKRIDGSLVHPEGNPQASAVTTGGVVPRFKAYQAIVMRAPLRAAASSCPGRNPNANRNEPTAVVVKGA